jgi:hypothetical protein
MRATLLGLLTLAASILPASSANATPIPFTVFAMANSSTGGVPLATVSVVAGDLLSVTVALNDCWAAGSGDRTTNADGLVGATTNACRLSPSTNFVLWTQLGASFPFASLVGQIGSGTPFLIGTSFNGVVTSSGVLTLMFWDSNNGDNFGDIVAMVDVTSTAVPEPSTALLMTLGALVFAIRRVRNRR